MQDSSKNFFFQLLLVGITTFVIVFLVKMALPILEKRYSAYIVEYLATRMSPMERQAYYEKITSSISSMWDIVPEAEVARIGQAGKITTHKQAEVKMNNAGMRSATPYRPKADNIYRIICLGDSFVFGTGGLEEDRFCNQIQAYYTENNIQVEGKRIEVLAVGLGSWNIVQETTYLTSRLSDYDPDLIVMLATPNDITSSSGVTGKGVLTSQYSPEYRNYGSGVFSNNVPAVLGIHINNLLAMDLSPISAKMWVKAMSSMKRLADLQQSRGKRILFSVLEIEEVFKNLYLHNYYRANIDAPVIATSYFRSKETRLPHDGHPNRYGHSILANHYIGLFDKLGWVAVEDPPPLHKKLSLTINPRVNESVLEKEKQKVARGYLHSKIDFDQLTANTAKAVMGGMLREENATTGQHILWGSVRSAFLLRREANQDKLTLVIEVPGKIELYPFSLVVSINGHRVLQETLSREQAGVRELTLPLPEVEYPYGVVEVLLETDSYFTQIADHRMKSFKLVSAKLL